MKKIISCDVHDHFEIACMRRSEVSVTLHNAKTINGYAKDLITKNKMEYFCITITDQDQDEIINLIDINTLRVKGIDATVKVS